MPHAVIPRFNSCQQLTHWVWLHAPVEEVIKEDGSRSLHIEAMVTIVPASVVLLRYIASNLGTDLAGAGGDGSR
jgi:hypothetical protein